MDVEHVWQPSALAASYGEHAQQRLGMGAQRAKVRQAGKHHRQVRDVTIDVVCWRRIILDNQNEFPVLRNNYAWSCSIRVLNNQEFKPDYI
jgi:hypothetical protein